MYDMRKVISDVYLDAAGTTSTYRSSRVCIPFRRGVRKDYDNAFE